ncbi:MAG TPA: DUF4344 domain-containing metallopeptidase [Xanthobacteraceae bacterium]|nr:DUF4344 domain-containing metallopeptidase [Xanthobacteraceae bacterium]
MLGAALACGFGQAAAQTVPVAGAQVHISYETSTKFSAVRDLLQRHKVLEKAQIFLSPLRLPREITIRAAECGAPSVPYDAQKGIVTICYEAVANIQGLAKGAASDPNDLAGLVTGGIVEEALHRISLAILQVFDIPVWGKEEDAADLLGAFLMLQFDAHTATVTILGAAQLFVANTSALGKVDYVSDVSPPAQRFYNFLCIAVGGDQIDFGGLVEKGFLPKDRAEGCRAEYEKIRRAFDIRLMPHVDADLVVKIRAIDWLNEDKN